jgi:hypothetical protein
MATLVDKRPKLPAGHRVTPDVVLRQRHRMWRRFVCIGFWISGGVAAHAEWPGGDFHKTQEGIIRQVPGVRAKTGVAKLRQCVTGHDALSGA